MKLAVKFVIAGLLAIALFWAWVQYRARAQEMQAEAAFPPEGQLLEIDGHQVHAVVIGEGPDLVLIHGASGNARDMTLSLAPRLAKEYRVIIFDRPGLGYSDRIEANGATIVQQAEMLSAAAQMLGAKRPIVMGHSYGGSVALAWAVHHPDNISALVPVAAPSHPWTSELSTYYKTLSHPILGPVVIPLITAFASEDRVEGVVTAIFAPDPVPPGYLDGFGTGLTLRRGSARANALQRANLLSEINALHGQYATLSIPTEIVHGTADTTVSISIHSRPLEQVIPGAVLTELDGIGHMPHHASQDEVVAAIHRAAKRAGLRPAP